VAAFTQDEIDRNWEIWQLFQNGAVVFFKNPDRLRGTMGQLTAAGYKVHEVDCRAHKNEGAFLGAIVEALGVYCYGGRTSLDGFNDYVSQLEFKGCTGVALSLVRFDLVYRRSEDLARAVLDILADNQRLSILSGDRLLTLAQSNDPELDVKIGPVGGFRPEWNQHERLLRDRGLV
jgi:hypothetical protein